MGILIAGGILRSTHIPASSIATFVRTAKHFIGFEAHWQKSPAFTCPIWISSKCIGWNQCRKHSTANSQRTSPSTFRVSLLVIDFPNRLITPLTGCVPDGSITGHQLKVGVCYNLFQIAKSFCKTSLIVLIHHHFSIHHISHRLSDASQLTVIIFPFSSLIVLQR